MDALLKLTPADQLDAYVEVNRAMGLDAASVEKDFWVCWTLREIFSDPDIGGHITFKGGTSLSKAWKLIERFSEDIDLIVDKEVLGFGGDAAPDKAPSNKQRKARVEALMDACRDWVQGTLQPTLASRIQSALGQSGWQLEVDPDMPDGQCLLFHYPTVFPANAAAYVRPVVKIELGARSGSRHPQSTSATGNPTTPPCSAPCSSVKLLLLRKSSPSPPTSRKPSMPPRNPNPLQDLQRNEIQISTQIDFGAGWRSCKKAL
jgi:hypothetical protein